MYKILSVGGSIIIPPGGFDILFLKKFRAIILSRVKRGERFILVIGGGATARWYQAGGRALGWSATDLDLAGIAATRLNAEFVKFLFKGAAHLQVVTNPTRKIITSKPIILAAGWKPGCSTDHDAVLLAKTYGAKEVLNLSNIDYVYERDPRQDPQAKKFSRLTWKDFQKIIGSKWRPGANVPFDPKAARLAAKLKLTVKFVKGTALTQVERALAGQPFSGSIISV